ncbi:MAG: hypothetical protein H6779_02020 [Candidatus Nomurabacteria bacterium]|nr:hypothetical protein [Candidatus Nomurabacteria bacterium]USN88201.1 MAG: hypothetical protein H6779_02020 [Candidatus Nomurabacteria bacterium]
MQSVEEILKRNSRVELDKAWETSKTRKVIIALITYFTASIFLFIIDNNAPFINAFVPTGGYLLSTLSMPLIKKWWVKNYIDKSVNILD